VQLVTVPEGQQQLAVAIVCLDNVGVLLVETEYYGHLGNVAMLLANLCIFVSEWAAVSLVMFMGNDGYLSKRVDVALTFF
jgi:hypothetical protein